MAVKKATKKTYPPAKKTVPKPKWVTAKELSAIMVETFARMDARHAEMAARHAEMDARHAETEATIAARNAEMDARHAKVEAEHEKTAAALRELSADVQKTSDEVRKTTVAVRELSKNMGGLNNSFGYLVEFVVVPKLRSAINAAGGHAFTVEKVLVDKEITAVIDGEKNSVGEIDMFLFSDTEALATEIKAQLNMNHVEKQLERLQKLRDYEEKAGIVGKKLFGAVVGIYINQMAKALALKNGLYVVEIREEEDKLNIEKPETRRTW